MKANLYNINNDNWRLSPEQLTDIRKHIEEGTALDYEIQLYHYYLEVRALEDLMIKNKIKEL